MSVPGETVNGEAIYLPSGPLNITFFDNSKNLLEDQMGLSVAQALTAISSRTLSYPCYQDGSECQCPESVADDQCTHNSDSGVIVGFPAATLAATSLRIGPGQWWALFYTVPFLYAASVLVWLLRRRMLFARMLEAEQATVRVP